MNTRRSKRHFSSKRIAPKLSADVRWLHLTSPAAFSRYVKIFADLPGFYNKVTDLIGPLDAVLFAGGIATQKYEPNQLNFLLRLNLLGLNPVSFVLANEYDRADPILQGYWQETAWRYRTLSSDPQRLTDMGLLMLHDPSTATRSVLEDSTCIAEGQIFASSLLVTQGQVSALASQLFDGSFSSCGIIGNNKSDFEGFVVIVENTGHVPEGWFFVDKKTHYGIRGDEPTLLALQGDAVCEIDTDGFLRAWPLNAGELKQLDHDQALVGRLSIQKPFDPSSPEDLLKFLDTSFTDNALHELALVHFPEVGRFFTNGMGRQARLQFLLDRCPHKALYKAALKEL
jgi:hypothetical protein